MEISVNRKIMPGGLSGGLLGLELMLSGCSSDDQAIANTNINPELK